MHAAPCWCACSGILQGWFKFTAAGLDQASYSVGTDLLLVFSEPLANDQI